MQDTNILRAIAVVLGAVGFGAGMWVFPPMRLTYFILLCAVLAGNLPQLAGSTSTFRRP